ncbi:MAG TPA: radical SAM protein, partial [Coriobacteriia bacterium]|nr:radical SAM protein [Coriobacteriia bacterium]
MQFDGMTSEVSRQVRGVDLLDTKLKAVESCRAAGVQIVLAMTIVSGINDDQIG